MTFSASTAPLSSPPVNDKDLHPLPTIETGIYQHYKGGLYEVKAVARHSEDLGIYVVYQALYDEMGLWIRPYDMFLEKIDVNGEIKNRFTFLGKTQDSQ